MTLGQAQKKFTYKIALLILCAYAYGYELTFGEVYESPDESNPEHLRTGQHPKRLAADLNLFKNGIYLTQTEDYQALGVFWKMLSEPGLQCRWGGDFKKLDGNHFEAMQVEGNS